MSSIIQTVNGRDRRHILCVAEQVKGGALCALRFSHYAARLIDIRVPTGSKQPRNICKGLISGYLRVVVTTMSMFLNIVQLRSENCKNPASLVSQYTHIVVILISEFSDIGKTSCRNSHVAKNQESLQNNNNKTTKQLQHFIFIFN